MLLQWCQISTNISAKECPTIFVTLLLAPRPVEACCSLLMQEKEKGLAYTDRQHTWLKQQPAAADEGCPFYWCPGRSRSRCGTRRRRRPWTWSGRRLRGRAPSAGLSCAISQGSASPDAAAARTRRCGIPPWLRRRAREGGRRQEQFGAAAVAASGARGPARLTTNCKLMTEELDTELRGVLFRFS